MDMLLELVEFWRPVYPCKKLDGGSVMLCVHRLAQKLAITESEIMHPCLCNFPCNLENVFPNAERSIHIQRI